MTGEKLRSRMAEMGITQLDLSLRLGVSRPYLSQVINGQRSPGLNLAAGIERVMGIPASEWAQGKDDA